MLHTMGFYWRETVSHLCFLLVLWKSERVGFFREVEDAFEKHYETNKTDLLDLEGVRRVLKDIEKQQPEINKQQPEVTGQTSLEEESSAPASGTMEFYGYSPEDKNIQQKQPEITGQTNLEEESSVSASRTMGFYGYTSPVDNRSLLTNKIDDTPMGIDELQAPVLRDSVEAQAANLFDNGNALGLDFSGGHFLENRENSSNDNSRNTIQQQLEASAVEHETTTCSNVNNNINSDNSRNKFQQQLEASSVGKETTTCGNVDNNINSSMFDNKSNQNQIQQQLGASDIENNTTTSNNDNNSINNNINGQSSPLQRNGEHEDKVDRDHDEKLDENSNDKKLRGTAKLSHPPACEQSNKKNNVTKQITPKPKQDKKKKKKNNNNNRKNSNRVSPDHKDVDSKSTKEDSSSEGSEEAPQTRKSNKTKYICKEGCESIVSTDLPIYCDAPNRLWKTVCHGCGVTITRAVMKATHAIYYCSKMGHVERGVITCSFVMCGACHLNRVETEGKQRRRTRGN